ncbi:protein LTV1 homolog, partial [Copidosoma floridanum]|uniref:protein LTV1 homolog n=1 Tax=Copidosoma floridanum TaxID=29053 RepID=UPI000C6F70BE
MSNLKKKFIDKRNSVTFQVVHRSLKDPLSADETAPQRVLVPVPDKKSTKQQINDNCDLKNQKEEQKKYGVFFDDDYNYLQHLRDVTKLHSEWVEEKCTAKQRSSIDGHNYKISLPSSAFESGIEEKVGLFNKVSPELNIQLESYDPDVIAALDDDFAFDDPNNELEDNFVELAEKKSLQDIILSNREFNEESYLHSNTTNNFNAFKNIKYAEDSQSCFTAYSMSSSIIKRNDKLNLLDDTFETTILLMTKST